MPPRIPDEYVLLCERCGYEIEGLPSESNCPECGKPVAESLPSQRTGTPWQHFALPHCLFATWRQLLRRPGQMFSIARAQIDDPGPLKPTLMIAAFFPVVAIGGYFLLNASLGAVRRGDLGRLVALTLSGVAIGLLGGILGFALLRLLTWIEQRGIRFWGPRRGWRITPAIAQVICAHASVGWLVGSVLAVIGHALGWVLADMTNHGNYGILRGPMQLAPISLPAIALIAGMLHFEILVYIGMTRMKFANRPRPAPLDASVPPASMPSPPSSDP